MTTTRATVVLVLSAVGLLGCSTEPFATDEDAPTYHRDVAPIVQRSCQGCHVAGGIAPFALSGYDEVQVASQRVAEATREGTMPPWGATETEDCKPTHGWKNDIRLSDDEIALLEAWHEAGAPEGDPEDATPGTPRSLELTGVSLELTPQAPWVTSGTSDEFRCFVMDPGLATLSFVNGTFIVPGNRGVVHHAVVVTDPERASLALADENGSYDCFGGTGVPAGEIVAVWTPGQEPFELPSNVGTPILPGSLLVMQIHYHPLGPAAEPDLTRLQLRLGTSVPEYLLAPARPIGNFEEQLANGDGLMTGPSFEIPANAADHVEEMQFTMPATGPEGEPLPDVWIYGAAAHMHYVGVDATITIERAGGGSECLLHDAWDFDWQRIYLYDTPLESLPQLYPGDKIKVRCRYDNTMNNPGVQRALSDEGLLAPIDVQLGEETTDEMCLTLLPLIVRTF
jgi:hypothetical protein